MDNSTSTETIATRQHFPQPRELFMPIPLLCWMMGVGIVVHLLTIPIAFVNIKVIVQTRVGQKRDISRSGNTWGLKKPGLKVGKISEFGPKFRGIRTFFRKFPFIISSYAVFSHSPQITTYFEY